MVEYLTPDITWEELVVSWEQNREWLISQMASSVGYQHSRTQKTVPVRGFIPNLSPQEQKYAVPLLTTKVGDRVGQEQHIKHFMMIYVLEIVAGLYLFKKYFIEAEAG